MWLIKIVVAMAIGYCLSYTFGWNLSQLLSGLLTKLSGKVLKIFWTQTFGLGPILFHFVSFTQKIFCFARILQLPSNNPNHTCVCSLGSVTSNMMGTCCHLAHEVHALTMALVSQFIVAPNPKNTSWVSFWWTKMHF